MSKEIDQRVVEMRFDNKNFEKNVENTMSTLDKLKQKLNLTGASKGLENIDTKAKNMNFSGLSSGVEAVSAKFSGLQVMGITALANITNSAVNAGKRIASALTIDPIKTGFQEYETQINAVQTILANTQHKGTNIDDVNKALDELNTYADKTIYNFTEMTRNIGTFTAAGVDLDTSVKSIQGIANLAAVSGSSSQQASTAMYQLSQALAAGKVSLQDWNSVVNAGMGGQVFQDALKRTAKNMGKDVDGMIKKYGSFRESLTQGDWLTTDVLTKTLEQFTMAAEEGSEEWNNFKKSLMDEGYTDKQATEILKMANTATDAATKVKTFTQLWDTLKESAQSGWTQTWEILVGDFEEAKELLTGISNVVGNFIGKSAQARNNLLQGWKDAGGRTATIDALKNAFEGIVNIVSPIREAFREIFPPLTVDQLLSFTEKFKQLTGNFADFTEKHGPQIKSTFKGIFAVLDVVATIVTKVAGGLLKVAGSLLGFTGGLLDGTASLGDFLSNIRDSVKESNIFGKAIDTVVTIIQNGINKVKEFGASIKETFMAKGYEGFVGFLKGVFEFITKIGTSLGKGIASIFGEDSFGDVVGSGLFAGLLAGLYKLVNNLNKPLESIAETFKSFKDGMTKVTGILDDVRGCLQAYQDQLKAGTLVKIATAVALLAGSIFIISTINPETLGQSLAAITVLFAELMGSMALFSKIPSLKGAWRAIPLMLSMSTALLILSGALKIIGSLEPTQMITGLIGVAGGMAVLVSALHLMPEKNVNSASRAIRKLSVALLILSGALKIIGSMSWNELGKGLAGITGGLIAMVAAVNLLPKDTGLRSLGMIGLATSLVILGTALKNMGSMNWLEIGRGLSALAGSLIIVVAALKLMPKNMITTGIGFIGVATALTILGVALKNMGSMKWDEIGRGLTALGGSLLILSVGLLAMRGSLGGAAALLVAASALTILSLVLKVLGGMSWEAIGKSLLTLASSFAIIGIAGALLTPVIPAILGLAGSLALLGVATLAIGAGLALVGIGITTLATSLAAGATAIVAGLQVIIMGILDLVPSIVLKMGEGIMAFCKVIGECSPMIADALLKLISELLKSLATYTPIIANSLFDLLIGVLDVLAARMPELIVATVKVINGFFVGLSEALKNLDGASLLKGTIAVGIMAGLVYILAGVSGFVGPAMIGLLGVGALIAELALILAAIGGLSQIPGLSWLIGEGGNLLEKIGTAIGQFIGGIVGGIAKGFTSSLPAIGTDLSTFMKNVQPFIDGAKMIDSSMLEGIKSLVSAILMLTGADIVSSIASFITGKSSLAEFGAQLVPFGENMKAYGEAVAGIDATAIIGSAHAAKALTMVAEAIPNSGGLVSLFAGDNNLADFATQLVPFGTSLKAYSLAVAGIDAQSIIQSASAAKALAEMMSIIPNEGGIVAWFTGENSVSKFAGRLKSLGTGLKEFSNETAGIIPENVTACSNAAKTLAEMMSIIPNEGGIVAWLTGENSVSKFTDNLKTLGTGLKEFSNETAGIVPENITACSNAAKSLAEMTKSIPNEGGMIAWFTGENSITKFAADLPDLGKGLKGFSDAVVGINPENITASANAAKALAQMVNVIPKEGGIKAWFTGETSVSNFANKLPDLGKGLKGFSDAIAGISPENVTSAANAAKSLAQMAETTPKDTSKIITFGDNLITFGKKLKTYFTNTSSITADSITASNNAVNAVKNAASGIDETKISSTATAINSLVDAIKKMNEISESSVKSFSDAIKKLAEVNVQTLIDAFDNAGPKLKTAGSTAITQLAEGITSQQPAVDLACDGITTAISDCETSIKNYQTSFYNAGSHLVSGFANGISENTYKSTAKARAMAIAAKNAAEEALDINSPSKVFYRIGAFTGEGFVNALIDSAHNVYNASSSIAESARKGITGAISRITDVLDSNMDSQPVIKPVLDLSDIQSGAGTINGMLNNVGIGTNLNAISSGMNSRNQNGVNSELVSAINKLRKDLGNVGGTTNNYNVNGITYDDGSNITDAVRTLVRAAKIERRV